MLRSVIACASVAGVVMACGGAARTGASPEELVGCYEVRVAAASPVDAAIPGFRLFLEAAAGGEPDTFRAGTILPNGREGVYPFNEWSLSDGQLIVRSSGQSGAILTLSVGGELWSGTMSYYSDVVGTDLPDVEVESSGVACG